MTSESLKSQIDHRKWRIDIGIKVIAIVAPFILSFWILSRQANYQRQYENEKMNQLIVHVNSEIWRNMEFISDKTVLPDGMLTELSILADGRVIITIPAIKFKTSIWEMANQKDYFFLMRTDLYYHIERLYGFFYEYNLHRDLFVTTTNTIKGLDRIKSSENYELAIKEAQTESRLANEYIVKIKSFGLEVADSLAAEIKSGELK